MSRFALAAVTAILALSLSPLRAAELTTDQKEAFLLKAKVTGEKSNKKGVTETVRVTLTDGKTTHEASVQRINQRKQIYQLQSGTTIVNFKDTFEDNVAAWRVARLLGLEDMLPPTVARSYKGDGASFTWFVDDVQMDEADRLSKKINPPDPEAFSKQINVMHVFDQLIYNWDANATNILIDKNWHVWMIDQSRSFRMEKTLEDPKMLGRCDRTLLTKLKALDEPMLTAALKQYSNKSEINALLARRDLIVKFMEAQGPAGLFDR